MKKITLNKLLLIFSIIVFCISLLTFVPFWITNSLIKKESNQVIFASFGLTMIIVLIFIFLIVSIISFLFFCKKMILFKRNNYFNFLQITFLSILLLFALSVMALIVTWEFAIIKYGITDLQKGIKWIDWFGMYSFNLMSKNKLTSLTQIATYQRIYCGLYMFINIWCYLSIGYIFFEKYLDQKSIGEDGDDGYKTMIANEIFGDSDKDIQNYPLLSGEESDNERYLEKNKLSCKNIYSTFEDDVNI